MVKLAILPVMPDSADANSEHSRQSHNTVESSSAFRVAQSRTKVAFDLLAAASIIIIISPLLLTITLFLLVAQGRPILIRHRRLGRSGMPFLCLKFRTMVVNADAILRDHLSQHPSAQAEWTATRKLKSDPRVTPIGAVLRHTSLDELPQLMNIVRGEMSFVGPRPIVQEEAERYGDRLTDYVSVRPGLTGLWQISGRSDTTYDHRIALDVDYIRRWTLLLDFKILAKTIPAVFKAKGSY